MWMMCQRVKMKGGLRLKGGLSSQIPFNSSHRCSLLHKYLGKWSQLKYFNQLSNHIKSPTFKRILRISWTNSKPKQPKWSTGTPLRFLINNLQKMNLNLWKSTKWRFNHHSIKHKNKHRLLWYKMKARSQCRWESKLTWCWIRKCLRWNMGSLRSFKIYISI